MPAAIVAALLVASATPGGQEPLRLVAEQVGPGIRLSVIGESTSAVEARFALEVRSDSSGGNNTSVQRGVARLVPGEQKRLMTLTLGNVAQGGWSATLSVEPNPGAPYRQVRQSD